VLANIAAANTPHWSPRITVECDAAASSTVHMSSTWVSSDGSAVARSESPVARLSWKITRLDEASSRK
jgi:hypothetical protein